MLHTNVSVSLDGCMYVCNYVSPKRPNGYGGRCRTESRREKTDWVFKFINIS